jgi:LPS-assembly lipoprotein
LIITILAGCGFQLRGSIALPFDSLYLDSKGAPSLAADMESNLRHGAKVRLTAKPDEAQATLHLGPEKSDKRILSIGGTGRVREYQLIYQVNFRVVDNASKDDLIEPQTVELRRDFSYDDSKVLAKEAEEQVLWRDMRTDAVQQIQRRLAVLRPKTKSEAQR